MVRSHNAHSAGQSEEPSVVHIGLETPSTRPSGLNRYLENLHSHLRSCGVKSSVVAVGDVCEPYQGYTIASSAAASLGFRLMRVWWYGLRSRSQDVLDAHFALYGLAPVLVAKARRQRVVVHFQGPWADESRAAGGREWVSKLKRTIEGMVYRRADRCVVLSEAFGDLLNRKYRIPKWALRVIPPGVDLKHFSPGDQGQARSNLGVDRDLWVALSVRRLVPRMGIDVLLEAWAIFLRTADRPVQLLIVGDGPELPRLARLVASEDLAGTVRLLGGVSDESLVSCYRAANVSLVPSIALEGFGLVVLESLACGTPVIGSSEGGLPEVLLPLDERLVVPSGDALRLARALSAALQGAGWLPASNACRKYAEKFSWESVARQHIDLYGFGKPRRNADPVLTRKIKRSPRVVVLDHTAQLSGGELAIARLLSALKDVDIHVVLGEEGPLSELLHQRDVSVEVLSMPGSWRRIRKDAVANTVGGAIRAIAGSFYIIRVIRRLLALRPDIVHTNSLKAAIYGGIAARLLGIPCLWHIRDRVERDYLPSRAVTLIRLLARTLPSQVVANSGSTLASLHLPECMGQVIPSPIEVEPRHGARDQGALRIADEEDVLLRIGMVGRIAPWKGQDLFLRAFAEAFPDNGHSAIVIGAPMFGEQAFLGYLRTLAADLGIEGRVEFRGFQENIERELSSLDMLVHASRIPEPFGQVVSEGMAAGLAVIAANAGGPAEMITAGVDGLLYTPGSISELAEHLRQLSYHSELRSRLGRRAMASVERFRPEVIAQRMRTVYEEMLVGSGRFKDS